MVETTKFFTLRHLHLRTWRGQPAPSATTCAWWLVRTNCLGPLRRIAPVRFPLRTCPAVRMNRPPKLDIVGILDSAHTAP